MKTSIKLAAIALGLSAIVLSGCSTNNYSGREYKANQAMRVMGVKEGTIQSLRPVTINGIQSGAGAVSGAGLGVLIGGAIGGGAGQQAAKIIMGLGGLIAGSKTEEAMARVEGVELIVKLNDGRVVAVAQRRDTDFNAGQKVNVIIYENEIRVVPVHTKAVNAVAE